MKTKGTIYPIRWFEIVGGIIIFAVILSTLIDWAVDSIKQLDDTPIGFSCYTEQAVLLNQRLENYSSCKAVNPCLFMDVYTEYASFLPCGHLDNIVWKNRTYYFANEGLRSDLKDNDSIEITWCYNSDLHESLIKEVRKK